MAKNFELNYDDIAVAGILVNGKQFGIIYNNL